MEPRLRAFMCCSVLPAYYPRGGLPLLRVLASVQGQTTLCWVILGDPDPGVPTGLAAAAPS